MNDCKNQPIKKCKILGVEVSVTNLQETLNIITERLDDLKGKYICVSNVHTIVMSYEDEFYKKIQNSSFMALPDGKPLSIVSKLKGFPEAERVTGPDLMYQIFNISEKRAYKHYFYGSTFETLETLKSELRATFPSLDISGIYSPPFRDITEIEDNEIIEEINKCKPDFVWVGLGAPKQELWMYKHLDKVHGLMIGVGAGFDYFAKNIKRAPMWMQKLSLEWLYRLLQDPKRLWKRYLIYNTRFIFLSIKDLFKPIFHDSR